MTPFQIWKRSVQLALTSTGNVAVGSAAFVASAHYWNPLPMILWGLSSIAWTLMASTSDKYTQRVLSENDARQDRQRMAARQQAIAGLDLEARDRHENLLSVRQKLDTALANEDQTTRDLMASELQKLDALADSYIGFLLTLARYREHAKFAERETVQRDLKLTKSRLEQEKDSRVAESLRQNLDLLQKRLDNFEKIARNARMLHAQLQAIENTFDLIYDSLVTIHSPTEVSSELEGLIGSVSATEQLLAETTPLLDEFERLTAA